MKKRLCYVISDVDTSLLIDANLRFLDKRRFDLTTIFLGPAVPALFETLQADGYDVRFILCRGKADIPRTIWELRRYFGAVRPDIVHTHLFNASITGLTAAALQGVAIRINTRHHSVEAHLYHPHAVWYDKYLNAVSTHIVAITDMVRRILVETEKVPEKKVSVVHHGFDFKRFDDSLSKPTNLKSRYMLDGNYPVIGVISRLIHWKGIQYIIPAFARLLRLYPDAKLVLANASGSYEPEVKRLLSTIDDESYRLIRFEREVLELYKSFDLFVHVPIGPEFEAFGLVYVEALAMERPAVFTLSGIANDFIQDRFNASVVPFEDSDATYHAMIELVENPDFANTLGKNGRCSVKEMFSVEKMVTRLENIYSHIGN